MLAQKEQIVVIRSVASFRVSGNGRGCAGIFELWLRGYFAELPSENKLGNSRGRARELVAYKSDVVG